MLCPNCESVNRDGAKFCDECGFPLTGAIARAASEANADEAADDRENAAHVRPNDKAEEIVSADETLENASADETVKMEPGAIIAESEAVDSDAESGEDVEGVDDGEGGSADATEAIAEIPGGGDGEGADAPVDSDATAAIMEVEADGASAEGAAADEGDVASSDETQMLDVDAGASPDDTVMLGADLAGFDRHADDYGERLVDADYRPPEVNFRDGGTMQMPRVEGAEPQKSKDYLASSTTKQKKNGKIALIVAVVVVAVAAIAAFATYQMQLWGGKVVPDVTGMTEADARGVLTDDGFEVKSEQVKSDDTEGLVLIMDPAAGSRTEEGSEVVIHIATTRTVPDVKGKTKDEAAKLLADAGYVNVKYAEKSSDSKKGTVLSVSPKAGERAKSTAEITVTTAKPYVVPELSGMAVDEAITTIEKNGLGYEVVYYDTDLYPEGTVVNTDPAAGTEVTKGTYVVLNVSQARGSKLEEAASAQLGAGATVDKGGRSYTIESLDSVAYIGNNTVSYTATAREYVYVFGSSISNPSTESISGTVVFNENDEIVSIS